MSESRFNVAVVGAGFSGICAGIKLKQAGIEFTIYERAERVGGTWRDNTYPGCECDIPSHLYSYSFERNPRWSKPFSPQAEILDYLEHCVEKYGIAPHLELGTSVRSARFDEDAGLWELTLGDGRVETARAVIFGTGPLTQPAFPQIPGIDSFEGASCHSARWDHDYDFADKRVAVIGTGASAIQIIPSLQKIVGHMTVLQRTPPWVMPRPRGRFSERTKRLFERVPALTFAYRNAIYWFLEALGVGFVVEPRINELRTKQMARTLTRLIEDPTLREKVTPDYVVGCKRILISSDYYPAITQTNVDVVAQAVREVTPRGVVSEDGVEHAVDAIVWATGFDVTAFLGHLDVTGLGGVDLKELWEKRDMDAFMGIVVSGFPNAYILVGPNTGLGHNSLIFMIEAQVHYAMECIETLRRRDLRFLDVKRGVESAFGQDVRRRLESTVWGTGCKSWYQNEEGKNVAIWPGFTLEYWLRTRRMNRQHFASVPN